ncbi:MAG: D-tyrosyl-tRNA(Tyr) deacylase [Syntrophomonadaceae bacterium]|nr:D-tyrosyl-tRNA(Tyr) deacylase [Syntrophomonadaceae bacterium]
MRAIVQRSRHSRVVVDNVEESHIDKGLMVLLGIKKGDRQRDADYMMDKIINLRIFEDEAGKMNRSLLDTGGSVLMVSQFTLFGDARKGRRPSFTEAEEPARAEALFDYCVDWLRGRGLNVGTGVFGADMLVAIENDGPVTILLDSQRNF